MGNFKASEKDIRIAVTNAIRALLEGEHAIKDSATRNYARLKELHWERWDEKSRAAAEHDHAEQLLTFTTSLKAVEEKYQQVALAMANSSLADARDALIDGKLVKTISEGIKSLQARIEAQRGIENREALNSLDMAAVIERFDRCCLGADDYCDVIQWLTLISAERWLMGEFNPANQSLRLFECNVEATGSACANTPAIEEVYAAMAFVNAVQWYMNHAPETEARQDIKKMRSIVADYGQSEMLYRNTEQLKKAIQSDLCLFFLINNVFDAKKLVLKQFITADLIKRHKKNPYLFQFPEAGTHEVRAFFELESAENWFMSKGKFAPKAKGAKPEERNTTATATSSTVDVIPLRDWRAENEVYRIAGAHKPGERWPNCIFDELLAIKKRTSEINLKVCERLCGLSGISDQANALLKAWKDHNLEKKRKARNRHDRGTKKARFEHVSEYKGTL
ncbi:hypothetical protein G9409_08335 [Chlorobium sp. BLA1]|uniref:hypothetical protein n=1 Tax=Candidatus Chlorobium masyuteum TaxID=2716876 RepID=UPI001423DFA9|nr:hypothetical protein [Candidatus Chlorobium masyuteum]NHQ60594.1 hypothetical protein [Candidatus Chlorobium masyuteum]